MDASYISLLERGERTPRVDTLESIAKALGVPLVLLVFMGASESELRSIDPETAQKLGHLVMTLLADDAPEAP